MQQTHWMQLKPLEAVIWLCLYTSCGCPVIYQTFIMHSTGRQTIDGEKRKRSCIECISVNTDTIYKSWHCYHGFSVMQWGNLPIASFWHFPHSLTGSLHWDWNPLCSSKWTEFIQPYWCWVHVPSINTICCITLCLYTHVYSALGAQEIVRHYKSTCWFEYINI